VLLDDNKGERWGWTEDIIISSFNNDLGQKNKHCSGKAEPRVVNC